MTNEWIKYRYTYIYLIENIKEKNIYIYMYRWKLCEKNVLQNTYKILDSKRII